tara:strand:- start:590 stop:1744 length:1155 start_codon:yes stop_codon:yes gene_type:complete
MKNKMKIMILGADGYLGWPMAIDLCFKQYNLILIDNYIKRKLQKKYKRLPLDNISKIESKLKILKKINKNIDFYNIDCTNFDALSKIFKKTKPDAVIHFAELPSAPYSMFGSNESWKTLQNNLQSTFNLAWCVKTYNSNCHIIKLGTMGEYGTPNIDIEEGWIDINHKKRNQKFLYPRQGSSLYHTSKIMDTDLLWFYVRLYNLRVTDLMQGPVYGINTHNELDTSLYPMFTYDDMFGTIINRFIVQAVAGIPLTIYGSGHQIRGYINIKDTIKCINLAIKNQPRRGDLKIFNQFTEQFNVKDLANKISKSLKLLDIKTKIQKINNPRIEKEKHYYNAKNSGMKKLGLKPTLLTDKIIIEIAKYVISNKDKINKSIILPRSNWK